MAIEYVDSTQLDSDLASVANAIRAKSGGSSQLAFPQGFVDAVEAIETVGGTELQSDFCVIRKETITAGANSVTNSQAHFNYLNGAKSIPGILFAFSVHQKASYVYNEYGAGHMLAPSTGASRQGYRYRNGWSANTYYSSTYDAKLVEGTVIDIFTCEILNPGT